MSTTLLPLLGAARADDAVAWRDAAAVRADAFVSAVLWLARRLPPARYALLLCEDRVRFAVGLASAACAGVEVLLPPARAPAVLAAIAERFVPAFALVDASGSFERMPEIVIDEAFVADSTFAVPMIPAERVVVTLFTSGSTGAPTPHRKTWGSLVRGAQALGERVGFAKGTTMLGAVPPQHMWGLEATVMLPLARGGLLHPAVPLLPEDLAAAISGVRAPRWLALTPIHVQSWLRAASRVPTIDGVLSATAPLSAEDAAHFEAACGAPVIEIYGSTETGAVATRRPAREHAFHLLPGLAARPSPTGITFAGGHLDSEVRVGDRVRIGDDGALELEGRDTDLVKIGGKRASLAHLTLALKRVPGVLDAAWLVDEPAGRLAPRLVAFVVAPGQQARTIRAALREHVDPVFLPRPLHLVPALPRTEVGKLRRADLVALLRDLEQAEAR